jgi:serine/threonine protein kinase
VELGEGGFGVVIKARLHGHHGFVAVKRVRPDRSSPSAVAEFEQEKLAHFALRSPHVV